ncbi:helix-turn-helix domain-containing protein [Clostridium thermobutyricum]
MENIKIDRWEQFNLIIGDEKLNIKEKGLLLILFRFVNYKTGYANPSRELLKKLYGTKKNDVLDKVLNSLIEKGYITRIKGQGERSKYFIKIGTQIELDTQMELGTQIEPIVGTQIEPQKEKEKKIKKKSEKKIYIDLDFIKPFISNVKITQEEYNLLIADFKKDIVHKKIIDFDSYIESNKKKYKNHFKVIYSWCNNETGSKKEEWDNIDWNKAFNNKNTTTAPGWENVEDFDTPCKVPGWEGLDWSKF